MNIRTFNLSLPAALVKKIDEAAERNYASRSEYIKRALLNQVRAEEQLARVFDRANKKGKRLGKFRKVSVVTPSEYCALSPEGTEDHTP